MTRVEVGETLLYLDPLGGDALYSARVVRVGERTLSAETGEGSRPWRAKLYDPQGPEGVVATTLYTGPLFRTAAEAYRSHAIRADERWERSYSEAQKARTRGSRLWALAEKAEKGWGMNTTPPHPDPDAESRAAAIAGALEQHGRGYLDLTTFNDGNAFYVLGAVSRSLRGAGWPATAVTAWQNEAAAGDYDHLLLAALDVTEHDEED